MKKSERNRLINTLPNELRGILKTIKAELAKATAMLDRGEIIEEQAANFDELVDHFALVARNADGGKYDPE